jgi:hypothetical protein
VLPTLNLRVGILGEKSPEDRNDRHSSTNRAADYLLVSVMISFCIIDTRFVDIYLHGSCRLLKKYQLANRYRAVGNDNEQREREMAEQERCQLSSDKNSIDSCSEPRTVARSVTRSTPLACYHAGCRCCEPSSGPTEAVAAPS